MFYVYLRSRLEIILDNGLSMYSIPSRCKCTSWTTTGTCIESILPCTIQIISSNSISFPFFSESHRRDPHGPGHKAPTEPGLLLLLQLVSIPHHRRSPLRTARPVQCQNIRGSEVGTRYASFMPMSHYRGSPQDLLRIPLVHALAPNGSSGDPQGFL